MKKKVKKSIKVFMPLIILVCFCMLIYYNKYSVSGSNGSIEYYLINKSNVNYENLSVKEQVDIDDIRIVIFSANGKTMQYAMFKKGLIGNYKYMYSTLYFDKTYISLIEKIHNSHYLISLGYNDQNNSSINTTLVSSYNPHEIRNESFNVKNDKYFIKYKVIDDQNLNSFYVNQYSVSN